MTTTELIELLKQYEKGASGRSREISFKVGRKFIFEPNITVDSTGDGICGAEITLKLKEDK